MNDAPLPCPFCGRKPSLRRGKRRAVDGLYAKAGTWFWKPGIGCAPCRISRDFESTEEALAWWNTRNSRIA